MRRLRFGILILAASLIGQTSWMAEARALPFNDDMVNTSMLSPGQIVRPAPKDSIPVGGLAYRYETEAECQNLENTQKKDPNSVFNGKRLFAVNCSPCHGSYEGSAYKPGPVGGKSIMAPPDIAAMDFYKQKTDGFFYGTIHFGGAAVMPAVGWKLSAAETWDIVNYVRSLQKGK